MKNLLDLNVGSFLLVLIFAFMAMFGENQPLRTKTFFWGCGMITLVIATEAMHTRKGK